MSEMSFFAKSIMEQKYAHELEDGRKETWPEIADRVSHHVMKALNIRKNYIDDVKDIIEKRQFIPGGRYLYAAGRPMHMTQNCFLLRAEDSREGWAELMRNSTMALMLGGGIGIDYSQIRSEGKIVRKTGGVATGPLSLMEMINCAGRGIMQGGSRRCLPDDTMVTMSDYTEKRIADIKIGDEVLTRFGAKKVTNVFDQGYQPVIKIETELGSIRTTGNHKLLTSTRSRTKTFYSPTSALNLDCKLYKVLVPTYTGGNDIDLGYAYVLGFYLGDGCSYSSGRTNEVTFQVDKPKYNQKQVNKICNTLNEMGYKTAVRKGHGECTEIRCQSIDAYNYFVEFKKPNTPFSIPENILNASLESRRAFMAGWFDADGYLGKDGFKLANTHESVRKEAKDFLEKLGFYITESGIELRLSSYQKQYFIESIGKYMFKKTRFGVHKSTSEIPVNIISISKEIAQVHTFDIEVEDVHEFIADGFVSHNSAIWAGLSWSHADVHKFIAMKNWIPEVRTLKEKDFNFPATMDGTNISVQLDEEFFKAFNNEKHPKYAQAQSVYWAVVRQMLKTAEPGFTVDIGENRGETLRNACCEITSRDDSDVCNLGSINMARISSLEEMKKVVDLATLFLLAGTVYSDVPYDKVDQVRTKNRRLGLGLMGLHEWLLLHGKKYGPDEELQKYMEIYATSTDIAKKYAEKYDLSAPVKTRAIAPVGTIGIVAETTTGIEPVFCVSYKRRYKKGSDMNAFQYVIDPTAKKLIDKGVNPDHIEDAYVLAEDVERRVSFQAWVQGYVDHAISSTINLPPWGSEKNNDNTVQSFGNMLIKHLPKLRGITCYPDGARGGQPLTPVRYLTAAKHVGEVFYESADVCDITRAGSCGS